MVCAATLSAIMATSLTVEWWQTAQNGQREPSLLSEMPPLTMEDVGVVPPSAATLSVDTSRAFQEILGFGGAFTEAAANNWLRLSADDQKRLINLYFGAPDKGGLGFSLGRVPINSCDFSVATYSFDDVAGDVSSRCARRHPLTPRTRDAPRRMIAA